MSWLDVISSIVRGIYETVDQRREREERREERRRERETRAWAEAQRRKRK